MKDRKVNENGVGRRVTICRDARKRLAGWRPLSNQLDTVPFIGDGRTDRASLQRVTRIALIRRRHKDDYCRDARSKRPSPNGGTASVVVKL